MPYFKDAAGREWRFTPSLGLFDAIQEATGVDLIPDGNDVSAVMSLPMNRKKLADVAWAAVKSNANGVTREQFRESLDGDALTAVWGALLDAVVFFTPSSKRKEVQALIEVQLEVGEREVLAVVDTLKSPETAEAIQQAIDIAVAEMRDGIPKALATGAMNSPE